MKIKTIKLNNGCFVDISVPRNDIYIYNDGMTFHKTHQLGWSFVPRIITKIQKKIKGEKTNKRYELKQKEMASDHIPNVLPIDEVKCCDCHDSYFCTCKWVEDYAHLRSLYEEKYDMLPDTLEDIDFEIIEYGKYDIDFEYKELNKKTYRTSWKSDGEFKIKANSSFKTDIISEILYPSVMRSELPCKLDPVDWYRIIRYHINKNIDNRYAYISSNYDFCLTVKKTVYKTLEDSLNDITRQKARVIEADVTIFECAPKPYNKYTVLPSISGDNYNDLIEKIETYLDKLMEKINKPTHVCDKCSGHGYVEFESHGKEAKDDKNI